MGGRGNPRRGEGKSRIVKLNHIIEESAFHGEMRWLTCGFVAVWLRWLTCGDVAAVADVWRCECIPFFPRTLSGVTFKKKRNSRDLLVSSGCESIA